MTSGVYPNIQAGQRVTSSLLRSMLSPIAYKTLDESRSLTTTLAADNELFVNVEANAKYIMHGYIIGSQNLATSATTGYQMSWYGPTGAAFSWTSFGTTGPANISTYSVNVMSISQTNNQPSNGGNFVATGPQGSLETSSTAGIFGFRWTQVASNATATIIRAKSWIRLERIA